MYKSCRPTRYGRTCKSAPTVHKILFQQPHIAIVRNNVNIKNKWCHVLRNNNTLATQTLQDATVACAIEFTITAEP